MRILRSIALDARRLAGPEASFSAEVLSTFEDQSRSFWHVGREEYDSIGAASLLLHPIMQRLSPWMVLEGAPGQGKSTITQYICQVHRMRLLAKSKLLQGIPQHHLSTPVRLPFRIDLRDLAAWLNRKDPFTAEGGESIPPTWQKSLESFLAAQVQYHSGGIEFSQADLAAVVKLSLRPASLRRTG